MAWITRKKITHLWICWYHIPFLTYATLLKLHTLWFIAMSSSNPLWASNYLGVALARAPPCLMQFIRASSNVLKSRLQSDKPLSTSCNWTPTCCLDFFVLEHDHFLKGLLWNISSYVFILPKNSETPKVIQPNRNVYCKPVKIGAI